MFDVFKKNMDSENYNTLIMDYQVLYHNKQCVKWSMLHSLKKTTNIIALDLFSQLHNKYNYKEFKYIVLNDKKVHSLLQSNLQLKGIYQAFILELHFTIEIYISFMIEYIFKQEIRNNTELKVISSYDLDMIKKIDLIIGNKPIQIKNYSFISSNQILDKRLSDYKKCNNLYFIFYTLGKDNIYFVEIDNKVFINVNDINGFTALLDNKEITLLETIDKIKAAAC